MGSIKDFFKAKTFDATKFPKEWYKMELPESFGVVKVTEQMLIEAITDMINDYYMTCDEVVGKEDKDLTYAFVIQYLSDFGFFTDEESKFVGSDGKILYSLNDLIMGACKEFYEIYIQTLHSELFQKWLKAFNLPVDIYKLKYNTIGQVMLGCMFAGKLDDIKNNNFVADFKFQIVG